MYKTKDKTYYDNLVYFGARYYDPLIGRFTTPDPIKMIDSPNIYLYCKSDPVNGVDYWGEDVVNKSSRIIYVKPESGPDTKKAIPVKPGDTYKGKVDGFTTPDGRVIKVRDKDRFPFTIDVVVTDDGYDVDGPDIIVTIELIEPPDDDWKAIFKKAKEMRERICNGK